MKILYVCKRLRMTKQYQQDTLFGSVQAQASKHKMSMQLLSWFLSFHGVFLLVFNTPNSLPLGAPDSSCVGSGALFWSFTSHWFCDYERILMDTHETMKNNCTYISGASLEWFSGYRVLLIFGLPIYWKTQLVRDLVWFNLIYLTVEIGGYQHESNLKLAVLSNA